MGVQQHCIRTVIINMGQARVARCKGHDERLAIGTNHGGVGSGFVAVKLSGAQSSSLHRLDDELRSLIAKHPDTDHLWRQAMHDIAHKIYGDLTRRRCKDKANCIGTEGYCHQRILFIGETADLNEHPRTLLTHRQRNPQFRQSSSRVCRSH